MTTRSNRKRTRAAGWFWLAVTVFGTGTVVPAFAGPLNVGAWSEFSFTDAGLPAAGCDPDDPAGGFCIPSSGTPTLFLNTPPWTFTAAVQGATLTVTDAFVSGDRFEIFDFGVSLGLTSAPIPGIDCGDDPVPCLATPQVSSGIFSLGAGDHSITLVPTLSPDGGGSGYLLAAQAIPEPGVPMLLGSGLAAAWLYHQLRFRRRKNRRQS